MPGKTFKAAAVPGTVRVVRYNTAFIEGQGTVGDHKVGIEFKLCPQTGTGRTGAEGIVKRKQPGLQFGNGNPAIRAGILLRKKIFGRLAVKFRLNQNYPVGGLQGSFDRLRQPGAYFRSNYQAVDNYFDGVFFLLVQFSAFVKA